MIIYDPLYGRYSLPPFLSKLVVTPEVRRLSQVRLLNAMTPSLATLGELRRYSHTLGVLFLCDQNRSPGFSDEERKALAASVLLHDIGTPPFGHLFEYHLKEIAGWNHENIINAVLWGQHAPENRAHQIFANQIIEFRNALGKSKISLDLVQAIVRKQHPLSLLLFGTLDLDNLDNVARMGFALGMHGGGDIAVQLASSLAVARGNTIYLAHGEHEHAVRHWAELRRQVYDLLVFDSQTVAAQAVLSECLGIAIREGILTQEDWSLTDEDLLTTLLQHPQTKHYIARQFLGKLPSMVFAIQCEGTFQGLELDGRAEAKAMIEQILRKEFPSEKVLGYSFIDNGTFEKRLEFHEPQSTRRWSVGQTSKSIVLYGFVQSTRNGKTARKMRAAQSLLEKLAIPSERLTRCYIGETTHTSNDQRSFTLTTT